MPRELSTGYIDSLNAQFSGEGDLLFLTAQGRTLTDIRLVNDAALPDGQPIQYDIGGVRWIGMPFQMTLLSDDDQQPKGSLQFLNVDNIIGGIVSELSDSPIIKVEVLKMSDFFRGAGPNSGVMFEDTNGADVEITIDRIKLLNANIDPVWVTCDIYTFDYSQEPFPSTRAMKNRYPCIFR